MTLRRLAPKESSAGAAWTSAGMAGFRQFCCYLVTMWSTKAIASERGRYMRSVTCLAVIVSALMAQVVAADSPIQIPLVVGLTTMRAVSGPLGDYESVQVLDEISQSSFKLVRAAEAPDDSGTTREISVSRRVRLEDLRTARILREYFHESDPSEFPGTCPLATTVMVNELRTAGKTKVTYLDVEPQFGRTVVTRTLSGMLTRIGTGPVDVPLPVNGKRIALRALHVAGRLADGDESESFEYYILDDAANPLLLRSKGPGFSSAITRIDFPLPKDALDSLERSLAQQRPVVVYGIYFAFARANIRAVSNNVLKQIAAVLRKNPDWKLRIDGHTDNIGADKSNLELSKRRAEAVKTALVERYGILASRLKTGGYGASQPQEKNTTVEGRARNRRVVLTRE
jgi:outer membrane protein OmpA-like peptidoglycan-associated protein